MNGYFKKLKKSNILNYLALSLLLTGCDLPEVNGEDPNALVEVSPEIFTKILSPELNKINLRDLSTGDMAAYETSYVLENGDKKLLDAKRRFIKEANWTTDPAKIAMDYQYTDYSDDKNSFIKDEVWNNIGNPLNFAVQSLQEFISFSDEPVYEYRYYNMQTSNKVLNPPKSVMNKANCGGLKGCNITGVEVKYVRHLLENGSIIDRSEITEFISHEVPPLFLQDTHDPRFGAFYPMAYSCRKFLFEGLLVNMCNVLTDLDIK